MNERIPTVAAFSTAAIAVVALVFTSTAFAAPDQDNVAKNAAASKAAAQPVKRTKSKEESKDAPRDGVRQKVRPMLESSPAFGSMDPDKKK